VRPTLFEHGGGPGSENTGTCANPWLHWLAGKPLAGLTWLPGHECSEPPPAEVPCTTPAVVSDWNVAFDWLYLTTRGADFPYAYPACDCATVPDGPAAVLDYDYEPGYRWRVSRRLGGIWFDVSGLHYLSETSNAVGADEPHELRSLVFVAPAADANFAAARNELKMTVLDADARAIVCTLGNCDIELFGGLRVARIDQGTDFYFVGSDWGSVAVDVRGAGVRGGIGSRLQLGRCFLWGRSALSLLAAQVEMDYMQHRAGGPRTISEYHLDDDRLVPVFDLELGLGYEIYRGWAVAAGYLYSIWFNVAGPEDFVSGLRAGDYYGDVDDELSFDGFFLRLQYGR